MRLVTALATTIAVFVSQSTLLGQSSQSSQSSPSTSVPRLVNVSGAFRPADGQPAAQTEVVTLGIYADETGGTPLWQETQTITIDKSGRYTLLLGATAPDGIPVEVFASGEARWLAMVWNRTGEVQAPRTRLTSVPYAIRASDADTLGGKPASSYVLAAGSDSDTATSARSATDSTATPNVVNPGTVNFLAKYVTSSDVGTSALYEGSGLLGINTANPFDVVHARFFNPGGTMTGLAVQNMAGTSTSYSGMLFYDHLGNLGQFQGFNNVTHEYRINNVARDPVSTNYNGSIRFMLGGATQFLVDPSVGIGMYSPVGILAGNANIGLFVNSSGNAAVSAQDTNPAGTAIYGFSSSSNAIGVFGATDTGKAVAGYASNAAVGWAGFFDGDLAVTGTLYKGAGAFRIDHPLDPEHKYLNHSFVESPDMKNIYDGVAVLDETGEATVTLPDWFEALNQDFRYQLTPMGAAFVPYIAEEIADNQFRIAGGSPGQKVSWQVTGIRHDAFANANRIQVEEVKPDAAVGTYLHPAAFGQSPDTDLATPAAQDQNVGPTDAVKTRLRAISQKPAKR